MQIVKLAKITRANFRKGPWRLWEDHGTKLKPTEVLCLVSRGGDQVMFLWTPLVLVEQAANGPINAMRSERVQLHRKTPFTPYMLQNYAGQCGLKLQGVPSYEDYWAKLQAATAVR